MEAGAAGGSPRERPTGARAFPQERYPFLRPPELQGGPFDCFQVVIVGAGPVGLTLALTLARHGIRCVVLDDDDSVCTGSRALGMSRRTLEIWDALGAVDEIAAHGCSWNTGQSFYRGRTVLEFAMPDDPSIRYRPMFNIQQCHTEQYLVRALSAHPLAEIRWHSRFVGLTESDAQVAVRVDTPEGGYTLDARYVVACDGARSDVRTTLGLKMEGTSYEAAYIIADIRLDTDTPMGRRCWFDPPSNPGATILMHGQPDGLWRLDYQLREDEDPDTATRPENVMPRIQTHLDLIGERGRWTLEWISMYRVHSRALRDFRHGRRVFFAGDAAHLMPIFGIRGLNSGVEDAWNLGWKLAYVEQGLASDTLLESYSTERRAVYRENTALAERNAWFMTPPSRGVKILRDAVLALATDCPAVRDIINPKQAAYVPLRDSPLSSFPEQSALFSAGPPPGEVLPDFMVSVSSGGATRAVGLQTLAEAGFAAVYFAGAGAEAAGPLRALDEIGRRFPLRTIVVSRRGTGLADCTVVDDRSGRLHEWFGARTGTLYLVRPDHNVAARWLEFDPDGLVAALEQTLGPAAQSNRTMDDDTQVLSNLVSAPERLYRLIGQAASDAGPEREASFLARLSLLLSLEIGDAAVVRRLVELASREP